MRVKLLSVIMLVALFSCKKHTAEEVMINDIVHNHDSLDSLLIHNPITKKYFDATNEISRADIIQHLRPFNGGYTLVASGWFLDKWYYSEYSDSLDRIIREYRIIQESNEANEFIFEFEKTEKSWELIKMYPYSHNLDMSN